jgi:hypothetical protein
MLIVYAAVMVLATWLLNYFFRKWLDIVLWPRVSDWWASWSQKRLRNKIQSLEYKLGRPIAGDEIIIYGIEGIFLFWLYVLCFLVANETPGTFPKTLLSLPGTAFLRNVTLPVSDTDLSAWIHLGAFCFPYFTALWLYQRVGVKYRQWKYPNSYQSTLKRRVANLREQFALKYPGAELGLDFDHLKLPAEQIPTMNVEELRLILALQEQLLKVAEVQSQVLKTLLVNSDSLNKLTDLIKRLPNTETKE